MNRSHYIITGTSRGIGEEVARRLLEKGYTVHGIARGVSSALTHYNNYNHIIFDLSHTLGIEMILNQIFERIDLNETEMICLINNAAMLEPLKPIDQCNAEEINKSLQISLVAPMVLTSCFMNQTKNYELRKKVINISSGSGTYPAPSMSVYCSAKAGINMFTQCVGAEQSKQGHPIEIIAIDPGMVDTELQAVARGKNNQQFELATFFTQAYETGQLKSLAAIGENIVNIIEQTHDVNGAILRSI